MMWMASVVLIAVIVVIAGGILILDTIIRHYILYIILSTTYLAFGMLSCSIRMLLPISSPETL